MNETVNNIDKVLKAEERIKNNSWDTEAWNVLLRDAQSKPIDESRPVFERLVKQFPSSGQYIKSYISQEKKAKNFENVEKLFKEYLPRIYNIELWKFYLSYIKEKDNKTLSFKEKMAQAYDYALKRMGLDLKSYNIWWDYISFLKSTQVKNAYAESQKTTATRRIFHRAIVTPMHGIEIIWREYNNFETSINNVIAKKFVEERSKDYMNARRVTKEYEICTKGLNINMASVPPQNSAEEIKQVELWKKYIQWEKDNPLRTEDLVTVTKRTLFVYEQCLLCLGHHPDIWYEVAIYLEQASKLLAEKGDHKHAIKYADKVSEMYLRATTLLKDNLLLGFAYADYEESRSHFDKVETIYKNIIANTNINPTLAYIQYSRFVRRSKGIMAAREVFKQAREDTRTNHQIYINAAMIEHYCTKDSKVAQKIFELGLKKYMKDPEYVLAYFDYMYNLNEDNNTRVLFERVLRSNYMSPEKSRIIWDRFLQFELNVGDLASVLNVERRRLQAMEGLSEYKCHQTALLIDRYKFMDLFPCNDSELKSIGYKDHTRTSSSQILTLIPDLNHNIGSGIDNVAETTQSFKRPDYGQMLPYKPKAYPRTGSHPVSGGEFPAPPAASSVMRMIPPPDCFHGPFVNVHKFMEHFLELNVPEEYANPPPGDFIDDGTAMSIEIANTGLLNRKRKLTSAMADFAGGNRDSDDEMDANNAAPSNIAGIPTIQSALGVKIDLFRSRQQKRHRLSSSTSQ